MSGACLSVRERVRVIEQELGGRIIEIFLEADDKLRDWSFIYVLKYRAYYCRRPAKEPILLGFNKRDAARYYNMILQGRPEDLPPQVREQWNEATSDE